MAHQPARTHLLRFRRRVVVVVVGIRVSLLVFAVKVDKEVVDLTVVEPSGFPFAVEQDENTDPTGRVSWGLGWNVTWRRLGAHLILS